MLPLWRDLYRIVLHPGRISLTRVQKGRFSKAAAMSADLEIPISTSPAWQGVLSQLEELISSIQPSNADVEVVLSNHFVRYAVIPWSNEVMDAAETQAMTRICFEQVYGDLVADWDVRLSDAGYGEPRLASAVDRALIAALAQFFDKTSLRLVSVQPFLMTAFNLCRNKMPEDDYLLLLEEAGRLCLVQIRNRQWSLIRQFSISNLADELPGLLHREALLNGLDATLVRYRLPLECVRDNSAITDMQIFSFPATKSQSDIELRSV